MITDWTQKIPIPAQSELGADFFFQACLASCRSLLGYLGFYCSSLEERTAERFYVPTYSRKTMVDISTRDVPWETCRRTTCEALSASLETYHELSHSQWPTATPHQRKPAMAAGSQARNGSIGSRSIFLVCSRQPPHPLMHKQHTKERMVHDRRPGMYLARP